MPVSRMLAHNSNRCSFPAARMGSSQGVTWKIQPCTGKYRAENRTAGRGARNVPYAGPQYPLKNAEVPFGGGETGRGRSALGCDRGRKDRTALLSSRRRWVRTAVTFLDLGTQFRTTPPRRVVHPTWSDPCSLVPSNLAAG